MVRIGVFICHCGTNIGGVVDVPKVVEYAKGLPGVVFVERNLYTCADDGLTAIKNAINEMDLDRVLVASCTPRTHEPLFRSACAEAGLNPYLFEFVNIREHCSWVHMRIPEEATEKACELVRMGVARATLLEPQEESKLEVKPPAVVIGGGIAGMTSALSLANQGFETHLVEKEAELGGMHRSLYKVFPTNKDAAQVLNQKVEAVKGHKNIRLHTSAAIKDIEGYIGNFEVSLEEGGENIKFKAGVVIVATGALEFEPEGMYGYGEYDNVITQLQLETRLKEGKLGKPDKVVMIQCVGSRGSHFSYCSRICCMVAIKNAMIIKEKNPDTTVYILHNGIQVYGVEYEELYRRAMASGIRFKKYTPDRPPEITGDNGKLNVKYYHELMRKELEYPADLVVLSTPLVQHQDGYDVSKMLRVPLGIKDRFFFEAHVKLRPVDFATDGVFVCGCAHAPKDISESVSQALAAASGAAIPLSKGYVKVPAISSKVDEGICVGCGLCVKICPYQALSLVDYKLNIIEALCKGCGACVATCPTGALDQRHVQTNQIIAQIKSAFTYEEKLIEVGGD